MCSRRVCSELCELTVHSVSACICECEARCTLYTVLSVLVARERAKRKRLRRGSTETANWRLRSALKIED